MLNLWIWLVLHSGLPVTMACPGTTGQPVDHAERCDGFAMVGDELLPLWRGEVTR